LECKTNSFSKELFSEYSAESLLSSHFLWKNINIKMHKTTLLAIDLYVSETWSLTVRVEHRMRVFENDAEVNIYT
jgi:hypothetical protein